MFSRWQAKPFPANRSYVKQSAIWPLAFLSSACVYCDMSACNILLLDTALMKP